MASNRIACCLLGLALCGLSACSVGQREPSSRSVAYAGRCEREVAAERADSARVSLKLAFSSRAEQQLCRLVLDERRIRLTWADGMYEKRAHHGLRALRGCAGMLRSAVASGDVNT
jgi:hypothetical protein